MRAFVQIRSLAMTHQELAKRLEAMEAKHDSLMMKMMHRGLVHGLRTMRLDIPSAQNHDGAVNC